MKNPKERSTAILVGVAAGAILMALATSWNVPCWKEGRGRR